MIERAAQLPDGAHAVVEFSHTRLRNANAERQAKEDQLRRIAPWDESGPVALEEKCSLIVGIVNGILDGCVQVRPDAKAVSGLHDSANRSFGQNFGG